MCWLVRRRIAKTLLRLKSMYQYRIHNQPTDVVLQKEIVLYMKMAKWYLKLHGKKKCPFAYDSAIACYRAAAALDHAEAQYCICKLKVDEGKFRADLQASGVFDSASNAREMTDAYQEAHAFLSAAVAHKHIQAQRLLGLCYINGWGEPVDKNKGFDLIIASIEQEGSWDRVQKIFTTLNVNNVTFLSELFQRRKQ